MNANTLVFRDGVSPIDKIVAQTQENPLCLTLEDVVLEEPGHAIEGECWAPKLAPYKPWVHDESVDEAGGTDGDLLVVGALGMGISDEEREALISAALRGEGAAAAADEGERPRKRTPYELWTAGQTPVWQGPSARRDAAGAASARETSQSRETAEIDRETCEKARETSEWDSTPGEVSHPAVMTHFATNVPLSVRRDGDGYALSAVHLSQLRDHGLPDDDLVVVVPSFVDGAPVVRIAAEAFARRFTSGARVRLLVVPDTVKVVSAQAFGSVCAETIYLGAQVETYDPAPLDLALPNPRLEARRYLVDPRNKRFFVQDGCLLENPEAPRLLFAEAPYDQHFRIPEGVRVVGPALCAKGCPPPRVIDAPASLQRVDGSVHQETLWRAADPAAMRRIAARCGGRVTDFQSVEEGSCQYGFARGEALLVAGPPAPDSVSRRFSSAAHARVRGGATPSPHQIAADAANAMVAPASPVDRLALPRAVKGAPLTVIAERALITAPTTLAIPETVREIRDDNACKGTRKLMLAPGLRTIGAHCFCSRTLEGPVLIPESVTSIGEGSFEYALVRLEAADAVVHITSDQLISCFLEDPEDGIPFDFARYDDQLLVGRGLPDHLGALLHRLAAPFRLAPEMATRIVEALRERAGEAIQYVAREGDINMVRALAEAGFLEGDLFDRQIERLRASNRTDCVLYLMNWQHARQEATRAATPKRSRDRFAL